MEREEERKKVEERKVEEERGAEGQEEGREEKAEKENKKRKRLGRRGESDEIKSPPSKKMEHAEKMGGMEEIKRMLEEMGKKTEISKEEIKNEIHNAMQDVKKEMNERMREMERALERNEEEWKRERRETKERMERIELRQEEMRQKMKEMEKGGGDRDKVSEMEERMKSLERDMEATEKRRRKNNIVIKGEIEKFGEIGKIAADKIIEKVTGNAIKIEECIVVGRKGGEALVVKMRSWEEKREVMKKKKELGKEVRIYIEDDMTREERKVQEELRRRANEERKKGKRVGVGYRRIWIEDEEFEWSDRENIIRKVVRFRTEKV